MKKWKVSDILEAVAEEEEKAGNRWVALSAKNVARWLRRQPAPVSLPELMAVYEATLMYVFHGPLVPPTGSADERAERLANVLVTAAKRLGVPRRAS